MPAFTFTIYKCGLYQSITILENIHLKYNNSYKNDVTVILVKGLFRRVKILMMDFSFRSEWGTILDGLWINFQIV